MKNEPIIAYNHLQEEQEEQSHSHSSGSESEAKGHKAWRVMLNPIALVIEIAAIVTMLILMIEELLH